MKKVCLLIITLFIYSNSIAQITFQSKVLIGPETITKNPSGVKSIDIDMDGDMDIVASSFSGYISWYEYLPEYNTFKFHQVSEDIIESNGIDVGDIDGDGDNDIIAISNENIIWYENIDGAGVFNTPQNLVSNIMLQVTITTVDMDNDGDLDIITSSSVTGKINWFENLNNTGNFSEGNLIAENLQEPFELIAVDVDANLTIDVIIATKGDDSVNLIKDNNGDGVYGPPILISNQLLDLKDIHISDIDNDNDPDIVSGSYGDDKIAWYENDGGDFSNQQIVTDISVNFRYAVSIDMDADGDLDILSFTYTSKWAWYENLDGLGNFENNPTFTVNYLTQATNPIITDINNDGLDDVISFTTSSSGGYIKWYKGLDVNPKNFEDIRTVSSSIYNIYDVITGDINGDGWMDVVTSSGSKLAWYTNIDGQGSMTVQREIGGMSNAQGIDLADIDGDGDLDVLATGFNSDQVAWFENDEGQGNNWIKHVITNTTNGVISVASGDVDGDGDIDVFSASAYDGNISLFINEDGLGSFGDIQTLYYSASAIDVVSSDLDQDGDIDIVSLTSNGSIAWAENLDGLGNFSDKQQISCCAQNSRSIDVADFNGDSFLDILNSDNDGAGAQRIRYLRNDGLQEFTLRSLIYSNATEYTTYGDIDNDGDNDIISNTSYYENLDGEGDFASGINLNTDNIPTIEKNIHATDLNQDGRLDFLGASINYDHILWHKNVGNLENKISGSVNLDNDEDCNTFDYPVTNMMITSNNGQDSFSTFTQDDGTYFINVNEGDFETSINLGGLTYFSSTPNVHFSTVNISNPEAIADFCLESNSPTINLSISLFPLNNSRPGQEARYQINYKNLGTDIISNDIIFNFNDDALNFLNSSESTTNQSYGELIFSYQNLNPFETRSIELVFNVEQPPLVMLGDILNFEAEILPIDQDVQVQDNTVILDQIVVDSYDPNDISVVEGAAIFENEVANDLHYIIRFQNTGTAPAINVRVTNILDSNLDWETLTFENSSHNNYIQVVNGNSITFQFDDINLPDSTTNEPESHGFISYKIKPKNTVDIGDSMSNNANIFFDFNPPILTNSVTTVVVGLLNAYPPSNLEICDDDNNGIGIFDLTITEIEIIGGQDPTDLVLTFYETQSDAENAVNSIINPESYNNITNPQTIYARLENVAKGVFDTTNFDLIVNNSPSPVTPTPLEVCDDNNDGFAEFNLTDKDEEIIGGESNVTVSYHETLADAELGQFPLTSPYINIPTSTQIVYARVTNVATGCYTIVDLILIVQPTPEPVNPTPLEACDDNGDGYADFDLSSKDDEIIGGEPDVIVTYHETQADAETGNNPLPSPYTNYVNPQVVYVRAINPDTGCFTIVVLELIVLQSPVIVAVDDLVIFDENNDGIEIFDLTIRIPEMLNGQINVEVTFYETQQDAIDDVNEIINSSDYINISNPQTIFTRLENLENCFSVGSFVIFADPNLGTSQNLFEGLKIYPNPAKGFLNIDANGVVIEKIAIINLQGIFLKEASFKNSINVSNLTSGLYFIQLSIDGKTITKKFVKN